VRPRPAESVYVVPHRWRVWISREQGRSRKARFPNLSSTKEERRIAGRALDRETFRRAERRRIGERSTKLLSRFKASPDQFVVALGLKAVSVNAREAAAL